MSAFDAVDGSFTRLGYVADQGRPTKRHSRATITLTSGRVIAEGGWQHMREEIETETCNFTFDGILQRPHNYTWRDAVRHRNAVKLLARQLAFKETGEQATADE